MTFIAFKKLTLRFPGAGRNLFENFDLRLERSGGHGKVVALLGASGIGKSTLLRLVADTWLRKQLVASGSIEHGRNASRIAYLPQTPVFVEHLGVRFNLALFDRAKSLHGRICVEERQRFVNNLGVDTFINREKVSDLSGGQRQRVMLARTMAIDPQVLLLDEPGSSLDPPVRAEFLWQVREIIAQKVALALFVTHNLEEARVFADEVVFLTNSQNDAVSGFHIPVETKHFFNKPPNLAAASFVRAPFFSSMAPSAINVFCPAVPADCAAIGVDGTRVKPAKGAGMSGVIVFRTSDILGFRALDQPDFRLLLPYEVFAGSEQHIETGSILILDISDAVTYYNQMGLLIQ